MREVTLGRGPWVTLMVLMIAGLTSACASIMPPAAAPLTPLAAVR